MRSEEFVKVVRVREDEYAEDASEYLVTGLPIEEIVFWFPLSFQSILYSQLSSSSLRSRRLHANKPMQVIVTMHNGCPVASDIHKFHDDGSKSMRNLCRTMLYQ